MLALGGTGISLAYLEAKQPLSNSCLSADFEDLAITYQCREGRISDSLKQNLFDPAFQKARAKFFSDKGHLIGRQKDSYQLFIRSMKSTLDLTEWLTNQTLTTP